MGVVVAVAWHDAGDPYRLAAWEYVRVELARANRDVYIGQADPFTKSRALNEAIGRCPDDAVVVQHDADSFVPNDRLDAAVALAAAGPGLVVPFDRYAYLDGPSTEALLAGRTVPLAFEQEGPGGVGNVTVFQKQTWAAAGGYDERFGMWGGDDGAFAYAAGTLVAPLRRLPGPVYHLWHPRPADSVVGSDGYGVQMGILGKYRDADGDPAMMRQVLSAR